MITAAIITLGVVIVASLRTAERLGRNPKLDAIKEKRRLLERNRAIWIASFNSELRPKDRSEYWKNVEKIDKQLLALADEEADE